MFISLLLIAVVMLSVSATFAASDDVAVGDGITNDEDVLAIEDVGSIAVKDDAIVKADSSNEVYGNSSDIVTKDTFKNYFDSEGFLYDNITSDELIFEGDFSGVTDAIFVNKSITFTGNDATFNGTCFYILSNNVVIDGFNLINSDVFGIHIDDGISDVVISNNYINLAAKDNSDAFAIYALAVNNLKIINNTIAYVGNTVGDRVNNAMYIKGSAELDEYDEIQATPATNIEVDNNDFYIEIPSVKVPYDDWYVAHPASEGIVFEICENVTFTNNEVRVKYNNVSGSYDTIYAVSVKSPQVLDPAYGMPVGAAMSKNIEIGDNTVIADGHQYIYGIFISAEDFDIHDNGLTVVSDDYYANAIDIEGPSSGGFVSNNEIHVSSKGAAYGIYSAQVMGPVKDMVYFNNTLSVYSYAACGMELMELNPDVGKNVIILGGNYSYGVAASIGNIALIHDNSILTLCSNEGNTSTGDPILPLNTMGISLKGTADVYQNTIISTDIGINALQCDADFYYNNIIVAAQGNADNYAFYVNDASFVSIGLNNVTFVGKSDGKTKTSAVYIKNATAGSIFENNFNITIPSAPVDWQEIPKGSGNWVGFAVGAGIVLDDCNNVKFNQNDVTLNYSDSLGSGNTIYVLDFNGDNITVSENSINATGAEYIYGIVIAGDDFKVVNNTLDITSDVYYANGIDVEGNSTNGLVQQNIIGVESPNGVAYGIYSAMYGNVTDMTYSDNIIVAEAYVACAMELMENNPYVFDNLIYVGGNYTYGVVASIKDKGQIINNSIVAESNLIGNVSSLDPILPLTSMAISTKGDVDIFQNEVHSHAIGISCIEGEVNIFANEIDVEAKGDVDNYAIVLNDIPELSIFKNNVTFVGTTNGVSISNAVYLDNVSSSRIKSNNFDIFIPSAPVDWQEIPEGSGNWVGFPVTEGIVIEGYKDIIIADNNIDLITTDSIGIGGTIYVLDVKADGVTIKDNNIEAIGDEYIYGIQMSGKDFQIIRNNITVDSDYYANGIDIEGPANGIVESNYIEVNANTSAYAIYSGMNGQNVTAEYIANSINGTGYNVFGFSLGDIEAEVIDNEIILEGNYTTGIAYWGEYIDVNNNDVLLFSSEVGDEEIWEDFGVEAVGIKVVKGMADIQNNTVITSGKGISLTGVLPGVTICDNTLSILASDDKDAYAIYANDIKSEIGLSIEENFINYYGATKGTGINNAIYINNVTYAPTLVGNVFILDLVSSYVPWKEIPDGSGNWVSFPVSEGIVIKNSPGAILEYNGINVTYNDVIGDYDTIYVVDIDSDDVQVLHNEINATGNSYIYGIIISGDDFAILQNDIETTSNYYANGIDVEGPATGVIRDNGIMAKSTVSAYPVYSGMNGQNTSVEYIGNDIIGEAYFVIGMSLGDVESKVLENDIIATGNYTIGIAYRGSKLTVDNNLVVSNASNVGDEEIWDAFGTETEGIKIVKGDSTITFNHVETTAFSAVNALNTNASVHDNYLVGKKFIGDESVANALNSEVYNNTPTSSNKTATIVTITEVTGFGEVIGFVTDINGTPVAKDIVKYVTANETGYAKTDENGRFVVYDVANKVDIIFEGDSFLLASNATITLTDVAPARTKTSVDITTPVGYKVGDDVNVTIYVPGVMGPITVIVDGAVDETLLDENGTAVYTIENITEGEHSIVAIFEGDETHEASFNATNILVEVVATEFDDVTVSGDLIITATLVDGMGDVIPNATIIYAIGNITNTTTTDANGSFSIQSENGETISISYPGEYPFLPTTLTLTLKDIGPTVAESHFNIPGGVITLNGYAVDTKAGEQGMSYSTELLDSEGKPIAGVKIQFAVNDKIYNRTTNEDGGFTPYNLNMVRAGRYTMAFYFSGNENYTSAFGSVCVDLDKKPITISASAKTYKASATKSYTVTLSTKACSSADGKAHLSSGKKVTLLVNGKTYTGKTNSNNKVTFKLTNLSKKGVYTAKIAYAGDNTYESATKSVKITIK